jgi:very-short-patch-repair endonuclease
MYSHSNLHHDASPINFELARRLRRNSTETEGLLWERLRNRRFKNLKFRRQHALGPIIAHFIVILLNLL